MYNWIKAVNKDYQATVPNPGMIKGFMKEDKTSYMWCDRIVWTALDAKTYRGVAGFIFPYNYTSFEEMDFKVGLMEYDKRFHDKVVTFPNLIQTGGFTSQGFRASINQTMTQDPAESVTNAHMKITIDVYGDFPTSNWFLSSYIFIWITQLGYDDTNLQTRMAVLEQNMSQLSSNIQILQGNVLNLSQQMTTAIQDINQLQSQMSIAQKKIDRKMDKSQILTYKVGVFPIKQRKRKRSTPYDGKRMKIEDLVK